MLEKKEMKVGVLIWWSAERYTHSWSCPAIITRVGKKSFDVVSLDDFKENKDLRMNDEVNKTSRHEMRPCSLVETIEYLKRVECALTEFVSKKKRDFLDAKDKLREYKLQAKKFLVGRRRN
jgi:hypothetical protein